MHTAPDMTDFLVCKTSILKEYLSLLPLLWQPTTAQLNPPHIFIFSYIEKVSIQSIFFFPVLTCISMETGLSCRARWQIATAAHNICVLIGQIACKLSSLRTVNWVPGASTNPENVKKNNSVNFVMVSLSLQACEKMSHSDFAPPPRDREGDFIIILLPLNPQVSTHSTAIVFLQKSQPQRRQENSGFIDLFTVYYTAVTQI